MINLILCGGNGTRLWPISRTLMPKQFVQLFDNQSLFQLTVHRNRQMCSNHYIISNQEQYFLASDQLEEIKVDNIKYLLEPFGKNTAPAIALACFSLSPEEIILVTPSDHIVKDNNEYENVLKKAKKYALENYLVTFGITPTSPQIGFGYIESNNEDVIAFHEKPDVITAQKYLNAGNYYWNSGMFCFKVKVFLEELQKYAPKIYNASLLAYQNSRKRDIIRINFEDMDKIPEESIDYAVMEKSNRVKVIPSNIGWTDLGSFDSLYEELPKDDNGNTLNPNHISINCKNNLIYGNERTIATIDINNLIIVDTADALLISQKGSSQKVKKVVEEIRKNSELHNIHLTVHRPWGTYTTLEDSVGFKIKKIVVKPGKRLSLQKHFHRNEHWIVLSGTATVTVDDKITTVKPNQSTYINMGQNHRLANEGKIDLVIIEAQVGEYTGEDDIVRIEDDFKRY